MKKIAVEAAPGKVIIKIIDVPQKDKVLLELNSKVALDKKLTMEEIKRSYYYHPLQAIVINKGAAVQLKDGIEDINVGFGDIIIIGLGNYDPLLWEGDEYQIIRMSMINGYIKRDSEEYPEYAKKYLKGNMNVLEKV